MSARGEFTVVRESAGILRWRARGYVDEVVLAAAHRDADTLLETMQAEVSSICDLRSMDGFVPGLPIRGIRYAQRHAERLSRWVILSESRLVATLVVSVVPLLASNVSMVMAADDGDAVRLLRAADLGARTRNTASDRPSAKPADRAAGVRRNASGGQ